MNRYPLWKYIVIAISVFLGLLYTLPNFLVNHLLYRFHLYDQTPEPMQHFYSV